MDVLRYLGRNARDPRLAGLLVSGAALVFNALWEVYAVTSIQGWRFTSLHDSSVFVVVGAANAYVVTWLVWQRYVVGADAFTTGRALYIGAGLGVLSMATFFVVGFPIIGLLTDPTALGVGPVSGGELLLFPVTILLAGVMGAVVGLMLTFGIPAGICIAVAVLLAHCEANYR